MDGIMLLWNLSEGCCGGHGEIPFMVERPQLRVFAVDAPFDAERLRVVERADGAERKRFELLIRHVFTEAFEEQACGERSVNDQAGIAFDIKAVGAVVVNAVGVEGEGRVAKEQHWVGGDST